MNDYRNAAQVIFIFFASLYCLFSIGHFGGDGYADYLTAESIVLDRNLALYDRPDDTDQINYLKGLGVKGRDGKTYSARPGLGMPIILSFFYLLGHIFSGIFKGIPHDFITMFCVSFANPVILALSCLFVFIISNLLKFSLPTATVLSLIYGLSTMAPVYTRTGFADPAQVLFMLIALYFLLKYRDAGQAKYMALSALSIAYSVFIKPVGLIFLPAFFVYALSISAQKQAGMPRKRIRDLAVFIIFTTLPLVLIGAYNYYIYGNFLKFGAREASYIGKRAIESAHFLKGLYYYLFSTGKGFFLFNLPVVLSLFALQRIPKERKRETVLFILIFALNLLFYVKSFRRGSLFSWGPRYLLPSLPVLIFLVGDFYENYKNFIARSVLFILSLAGFLIMLPCMFVNQSKFYFFVVKELGLEEYMINFIPDLSPILGVWKMLVSNLATNLRHISMPFVYNPDYRLVAPIEAAMNKYNSFDFWFLKIIYYAPNYQGFVFLASAAMLFIVLISFLLISKNIKKAP